MSPDNRPATARACRSRRRGVALLSIGLGVWLLAGAFSIASGAIDICGAAAQRASAETGVPESLLRAIALTESGTYRQGRSMAWPWTVNTGGKGHWFHSRDEAQAYVDALRRQQVENFDVGCFQLNNRWHAEQFRSVSAMLSPDDNARYAALFLDRLRQELGSWQAAARAYHSRNPGQADVYEARLKTNLLKVGATFAVLDGSTGSTRVASRMPAPAASRMPEKSRIPAAERENLYPFLQVAQHETRMGSLVPLGAGSGRSPLRRD